MNTQQMEVGTMGSTRMLCSKEDLVEGSGVCALFSGPYGERQIAIFYLPDEEPKVYALDNFDPIGRANVLSRGIVGDIGGELVVASPLYKQHFSLKTGHCLEDTTIKVPTYSIELIDDQVILLAYE